MSGPRWRRFFRSKRALFALALLVGIFLLSEIAPRLMGVPAMRLERAVKLDLESCSAKPRPCCEALEEDGDGYRTNPEIFQIPSMPEQAGSRSAGQRFSKAKAPGRLRIAFFGGSTTYGFRAMDNYPALVRRQLNARGGAPVEVLNLGFIRWNSSDILKLLPLVLKQYRPDIVVAQCAHNELMDVKQFYLADRSRGRLAGFFRGLLERTFIYSYLRQYYVENWIPDTRGPYTGKDPLVRSRYNASVVELARRRLMKNLCLIEDKTHAAGAKLALVNGVYAASMWRTMKLWSLFAFSPDYSAADIQTMIVLFRKIEHALLDKKVQEAARLLAQVEDRTSGQYWSLRGWYWQQLGQQQKAARAYNRALDLTWRPFGSVMNPLVAAFGRQHKVPVVDAHAWLLSQSRGGVIAPGFFKNPGESDFMHPNARGHAEIARAIIQVLDREGLLKIPRREDEPSPQ